MPVTDPEKRRQISAAYYARHRNDPAFRERVRLQTTKWRAENPEKSAESTRRSSMTRGPRGYDRARSERYRAKHRDEILARGREYRATHSDQIKAASRARYALTREARLEYGKRWREDNADRHREMMRAWADANREHVRERTRNAQNARRSAANGLATLTREQWQDIKALYGHRCAYCDLPFERLTQDHVIPISKGGKHTAENVVPACRSCNSKKGNRSDMQPRAFTLPPRTSPSR